MVHRRQALATLGSVLLAPFALPELRAESPSGLPWQSDVNQAWRAAIQARRPLLMYFQMKQCIYCRKMERETFTDRGVVADINTMFVPVHLSAEQHRSLVQKLRVQTFPTTVILCPQEGVIGYMTGYQGPVQIRTRLRAAVASTPSAIRR
jgi:thioredoxin-related protein